jgi:hypothetical protein
VPAILEYVEANIPETYRLVTTGVPLPDGTTTPAWDGENGPDVFGIETQRTMAFLFKDGVSESDLSEIAKSYVADTVTLRTIAGLIDFYMVRTRRNDSMGRSSGVVPLGGESSANEDRIAALQDQAKRMTNRLNEMALDFAADAASLLRKSGSRMALGARISTTRDKVTLDPTWFPRSLGYPYFPFGGSYFGAGFGIPVIREVLPATPETMFLD